MNHPFQQATLQANSYYRLVQTWAEMQLVAEPERAYLHGYGYAHDIAQAFSALVLDWSAAIHLPEGTADLPPGNYDLIMQDGQLYACREQQRWPLPDAAVRVELLSEPEED